jgi:hypothetical protein
MRVSFLKLLRLDSLDDQAFDILILSEEPLGDDIVREEKLPAQIQEAIIKPFAANVSMEIVAVHHCLISLIQESIALGLLSYWLSNRAGN